MEIPREQVRNKLYELGFTFRSQAKRVDIYRRGSDGRRVTLTQRRLLDETAVRSVLGQAGCNNDEIESFLRAADCSNHN